METSKTTNQNWMEENDDVYFLEANELIKGLTTKQFIKSIKLYIERAKEHAEQDIIDQLVNGLNELSEKT